MEYGKGENYIPRTGFLHLIVTMHTVVCKHLNGEHLRKSPVQGSASYTQVCFSIQGTYHMCKIYR